MVIDDGVIKYRQNKFTQTDSLLTIEYHKVEFWRKKLFQLKLIGEYPTNKVGYGNLSQKKDYSQFHQTDSAQFVITGTQTGVLAELSGIHYTRVLDFNLDKFEIQMMGKIQASSESLTHAALYSSNSNIQAVFHIHHPLIWQELLKDKKTSTPKVEYGTSEMAKVAAYIARSKDYGIFAMAGHIEGVIAFGPDTEQAGEILLEAYQKFVG
jgi:hypothetical protein